MQETSGWGPHDPETTLLYRPQRSRGDGGGEEQQAAEEPSFKGWKATETAHQSRTWGSQGAIPSAEMRLWKNSTT